MVETFDFHFVNDQLMNMGAVHSASELQGYLTGLICGGKELSDVIWSQLAAEFLDLQAVAEFDTDANEASEALFALIYTQTKEPISDNQFAFTPLLPDEHLGLPLRLQELAAWCQGFLHGVGASGLAGDAAMTPESAEALRDLAQISQVDLAEDDAQNAEENEGYWVELVEYVRAAVMTFYLDLNSTAVPPTDAPSEPDVDATIH